MRSSPGRVSNRHAKPAFEGPVNACHFAFGEENQRVVLGAPIEPLVLPWRAHVFVDDVNPGVRISFVDIVHVLERGHAAH
jgi:hypothetical protein